LNPYDRQMTKVFVSYGREDLPAARRLTRYLSRAGADVWADFRSLAPGDSWRAEIVAAIRSSDFVVVLLSTRSADRRGFLHREIREALGVRQEMPGTRPYLIPARLDDCQFPIRELTDVHRVDLFPSWLPGARRIKQVVCPEIHAESQMPRGIGRGFTALININVWPGADLVEIASRVSRFKYVLNAKPTGNPFFPIIASYRGDPSKLHDVGQRIRRIPQVIKVEFILAK